MGLDALAIAEGTMSGVATKTALDQLTPSDQENIISLLTQIRNNLSPKEEKQNHNYPMPLLPYPLEYEIEEHWEGKPHFCLFLHDATPLRFDIEGIGTFLPTLGPGWVQCDVKGRISTTDGLNHNVIISYREDPVGEFLGILIASNQNTDGILLQQLTNVAAGTINTPQLINANGKGIMVCINVIAISAGSITVHIQELDPLNNAVNDILVSAALAAVAKTFLHIYPGIAVGANVSASAFLPRSYIISSVVVTGVVTATISGSLVG